MRKLVSAEKFGALSVAHPEVRMNIPAPAKSNASLHTCLSFIPSNGAAVPSTQFTSVTAVIKGVGNRV